MIQAIWCGWRWCQNSDATGVRAWVLKIRAGFISLTVNRLTGYKKTQTPKGKCRPRATIPRRESNTCPGRVLGMAAIKRQESQNSNQQF